VEPADRIPGTDRLDMEGDIASELVAGADAFLQEKLSRSVERRRAYWDRDTSSGEAYTTSVDGNREALARMVGLRETRPDSAGLTYVSTTEHPSLVAKSSRFDVHAVSWAAFSDVRGEGLLLSPNTAFVANVIAIPDAGQTPEQIAGLTEGVPEPSQYARRLAASGCRVVIPCLINRSKAIRGVTHRDYVYRSAFELGRHLIGYELQKVFAVVDWFEKLNDGLQTGVLGWGEGGLLSLYAAAIDQRIDAACVSGYFDSREDVWREPIDRNVFGLLEQFGDAEIASLVSPRPLVIEACGFPESRVEEGDGSGAPYELKTPLVDRVKAEVDRYRNLVRGLDDRTNLIASQDGQGTFGTDQTLGGFLSGLGATLSTGESGGLEVLQGVDTDARHARQVAELHRHNQRVLQSCAQTRDQFFEGLDTGTMDAFLGSVEPYR